MGRIGRSSSCLQVVGRKYGAGRSTMMARSRLWRMMWIDLRDLENEDFEVVGTPLAVS